MGGQDFYPEDIRQKAVTDNAAHHREAAQKRIASLTESCRRLIADQEEMLSLLREASEAIEPFARMGAPSPDASDYARARGVLAKIAKALTS